MVSLSRTIQLQVIVYRARKLVAADHDGFSDPYCILRIGKEEKKTSVRNKTLNPKWGGEDGKGEIFTFQVRLGVDFFLFVDIYDKDKTSTDDRLGCVHIPLLCVSGGHGKKWYAVERSHGRVPVSGEIQLALRLTGSLSTPIKLHMKELKFLTQEFSTFQCKRLVVDDKQYLFPGALEKMELVAEKVILSVSGHYRQGSLYLTNYRLLFHTQQSRKTYSQQLQVLRKALLSARDHKHDKHAQGKGGTSLPQQESALKFPAALRADISMAIPLGMIWSLHRTEGSAMTVTKAPSLSLKAKLKNFCCIQLLFTEEQAEPGVATHIGEDLFLRLLGRIHAGPLSLQTPLSQLLLSSSSSSSSSVPCFEPPAQRAAAAPFELETEMHRQGLRPSRDGKEHSVTLPLPVLSIQERDPIDGSESQLAFVSVEKPETRVDPAAAWRMTDVNANYQFCKSYPQHFFVPAAVSDATLKAAVAFRSKRRIPTLVWYNKKHGNSISRSAQPNSGPGWRNEADEQLVDALRGPGARGSSPPLLIFDARSFEAATGNKLKGKGTENTSTYTTSKLVFCDIGNIHDVRRSEDKLRDLIQGISYYSFWTNVGQTMWLQHIKKILEASSSIALALEQLRQSVLIHCSDGWDRTAQISSLAQLLLDSHYRTMAGFKTLIQKEWLLFGHKFGDRLARPEIPNERSPVFNQWLDAVFQVLSQFPEEFEFTDLFLLDLVDAVDSGWYVDFLFNSVREKAEYDKDKDRTPAVSVWHFLDANHDRYRNPTYIGASDKVLIPISSEKMLQFWSRRYLPWDECCLARLQANLDQYAPEGSEDSPKPPAFMPDLGAEADGKQPPQAADFWVPDHWSENCQGCGGQFNFFRRRHHCRACGRLFCYLCSDKRLPVKNGGVPERLCASCYLTRHTTQRTDYADDTPTEE